MSTKEEIQTGEEQATQNSLDPRDARALSERMTVLPEGGDVFEVVSESGSSYRVDLLEGRCTCADAEHNLPNDVREICKHGARVRFATGAWTIPSLADTESIDPLLGCSVDSTPQIASTDGETVVWATDLTENDCDDCADLRDGWVCADCYIKVGRGD